MTKPNLKLKFQPRKWQKRALEKWLEQKRGIVEVVTGGGKTVFAELCILEYLKIQNDGNVLIIVPSLALADQWAVSLQDELNVPKQKIGIKSGDETPEGSELIVISVINSARKFTKKFSADKSVFLIVDECHKAGSPANAKALNGTFLATLGLSATPERQYDTGFIDHIKPKLGEIIFVYSYADAHRDEVVSNFSLINVRINFLADERKLYDSYSSKIARLIRQGEEPSESERLIRLLQLRAAVTASATMRVPVSVKLAESHRGERCVIFHERIESANRIFDILKERGHRATIYHAKIGSAIRRDNLRLFRRGVFDILVCCRALDEGMNVPEAAIAVVASSTASLRQRIQRLGRILRKSKNKDHAMIYTLFATKEEESRLIDESNNLDGLAAVSWKKGGRKGNA